MQYMTKMSVVQFEEFIKKSFSRHHLLIERCSQVLFSQLAHMPGYGGINHPFQFVEREILYLEGRGKTETKPASPFKKSGKLRGLMHKHFYISGYGHLGINARNAWEFDRQNSKTFSEMALQLAKPYATDADTNTNDELKSFSEELAREFMHGEDGVKDRFAKEKGTGDWLIYTPHQLKNYYLCIAKHNEDDFILGALRDCVHEFSFLKEVLDQSDLGARHE
jgi:hypothetical protein